MSISTYALFVLVTVVGIVAILRAVFFTFISKSDPIKTVVPSKILEIIKQRKVEQDEEVSRKLIESLS